MRKLSPLFVALLVSLLLGAPAQAHTTNDQQVAPAPWRYVQSPVTTVGSSNYYAFNGVAPHTQGGWSLEHWAMTYQEHNFATPSNRTLQARTAWYCVVDKFNRTVAYPLYGGTPHGPATGTFYGAKDPYYSARGLGVEHCAVYQWNTEVIERNLLGQQTGYKLVITQVRIYYPVPPTL